MEKHEVFPSFIRCFQCSFSGGFYHRLMDSPLLRGSSFRGFPCFAEISPCSAEFPPHFAESSPYFADLTSCSAAPHFVDSPASRKYLLAPRDSLFISWIHPRFAEFPHCSAELPPHFAELTPCSAELPPHFAESSPHFAEFTSCSAGFSHHFVDSPPLRGITSLFRGIPSSFRGINTLLRGITSSLRGILTLFRGIDLLLRGIFPSFPGFSLASREYLPVPRN